VFDVHAASTISGVTIADGRVLAPYYSYYGSYPGYTAKAAASGPTTMRH